MLVSIDYDETWTQDPDLWRTFAYLLKRRGHTIILVTNRRVNPTCAAEISRAVGGNVGEIIFAGPRPKREAAAKRGYHPDVWIDDLPITVDGGRVGF